MAETRCGNDPFAKITPEARAELLEYAAYLKVKAQRKSRITFDEWRAELRRLDDAAREAYRAGYSSGHSDGRAGNAHADEERCNQFFGPATAGRGEGVSEKASER